MSTAEAWNTRPIGPGSILAGRYRLIDQLGAGGMGTVYRAEHLGLGKRVAVKVLHPHVATAPNAADRFQREARILAKLDHRNAVHVYDFGSDKGTLFIAMELLSGVSLDVLAVTPAGGIDLRRAVNLCGQALDVLATSHSMGIVHRDIKPGNIFVESPGDADHVKVVDFGLALITDEPGKSRLTEAGMVHGTPEYMAPEQCLGQPLDGRADIYAIGCVLWELITGVPPFGIGQAVQIMTAHVYKPLPALAEVAPEMEVPPAVEQVIQKALAKRAEDRFPDAFTMKTELIAALDAKTQALRGLEKTHDRGAPISQPVIGAPGQGVIGLWAQGATQAAGAGPAEALVAGGYQVKRVTTSTDSIGCSAIVVVPTPTDNHLTIAAKLAQMSGAPPVLLCGHEDDLALMTKAIEVGIHDFVPLPLDATDLVKKVTRALKRRKR